MTLVTSNRGRSVAHAAGQSRELAVSSPSSLTQLYPSSRRLEVLFQVPPSDQVRRALQHRGVPADPALLHADTAHKLDAMSSFGSSFLATDETATFVELVLAQVRRHLAAKNFGDEHYRRFYNQTIRVMNGEPLFPLPSSLESLSGSCLALVGPSMTGKTALLQRIRVMLGSPFSVEARPITRWRGSTPATMTFIPSLNLTYPSCNTTHGLLKDLRERLVPCISTDDTPAHVLTDLLGPNGENAAIAACILLNVSLITVDGGNLSSISGNAFEIPAFLLKLNQYSGIPVVLSGTCAYHHYISLAGSRSANLFSELQHHLDPLEEPGVDPDGGPRKDSIWYQKNLWYWSLGMVSRDIPMPESLPVWTYLAARGREGWLAQGFKALHVELIKKPRLLAPGALTQKEVTRVFELQLRMQKKARQVIAQLQQSNVVEDDADFYDYMDHFPLSFIRDDRNKGRVRAIRGA